MLLPKETLASVILLCLARAVSPNLSGRDDTYEDNKCTFRVDVTIWLNEGADTLAKYQFHSQMKNIYFST